MFRELVVLNFAIQSIFKNRTKIISAFCRERIDNKTFSKAWTKWRQWGAAEVV